MTRSQSPGYPQFALPKAIHGARQIFAADRRSPIDRSTAQKHIGYSGPSGAADKALATLAHYGLVERVGKGEVRVSQLAVDIIHPDKPQDRKTALVDAAFRPQIFKDLRERFGNHVSETALESYLVRESFLDRAIGPVTKAYLETCRFLEQEEAFESRGNEAPEGGESNPQEGEQGSMDMLVEDRRHASEAPSMVPVTPRIEMGESEWMRNVLGKGIKVRLLVSGGEMGTKEIGKLMKLLEAQQAVLEDDEE